MATRHDIERAASVWLVQMDQGDLSPEKLAEFDRWLANPLHEAAVARRLFAMLDAQFFGDPIGHDDA